MLTKGTVTIQHSLVFDDPLAHTRVFPRIVVLDLDVTAHVEHEEGLTSAPPERCYQSHGSIEILEVKPSFYHVDGNDVPYNEDKFFELTGETMKSIKETIDEDTLYLTALEML